MKSGVLFKYKDFLPVTSGTPMFSLGEGDTPLVRCEKLEKEIFSQKYFLEYAQSHFILFQVDFPRHKEQPLPLKNQNEALAKTYAISRFPTVLLIDPQGKETGRTGFRYGGANAYIEYLKGLLNDNGLMPNHKYLFPVSISP